MASVVPMEGFVFSCWLQGTDALCSAQASCSLSLVDAPACQATINLLREPGPVSPRRVANELTQAAVTTSRLCQRLLDICQVDSG